jgi:hypothetical protein
METAMNSEERNSLLRRYAEGPALLEATLARVPAAALQWRPAPGKWTVHEVILHCADSETNAHMRLRYLLAEPDPAIVPYDQDRWSIDLQYHALPLEPALATVRAVRANTTPLLQRLSDAQWLKLGRHPEHPDGYGVEKWLRVYGEHLEIHARQIERNRRAWDAR